MDCAARRARSAGGADPPAGRLDRDGRRDADRAPRHRRPALPEPAAGEPGLRAGRGRPRRRGPGDLPAGGARRCGDQGLPAATPRPRRRHRRRRRGRRPGQGRAAAAGTRGVDRRARAPWGSAVARGSSRPLRNGREPPCARRSSGRSTRSPSGTGSSARSCARRSPPAPCAATRRRPGRGGSTGPDQPVFARRIATCTSLHSAAGSMPSSVTRVVRSRYIIRRVRAQDRHVHCAALRTAGRRRARGQRRAQPLVGEDRPGRLTGGRARPHQQPVGGLVELVGGDGGLGQHLRAPRPAGAQRARRAGVPGPAQQRVLRRGPPPPTVRPDGRRARGRRRAA